jgi:hypothetical protein
VSWAAIRILSFSLRVGADGVWEKSGRVRSRVRVDGMMCVNTKSTSVSSSEDDPGSAGGLTTLRLRLHAS